MQKVVPAILTADPSVLKEQLGILKGHSNWVHIDIMDGKFVPNISISLFELGEAAQFFNLEIHLMVADPKKYFEDCAAVSAKRVIYHWEATHDISGDYPFQKGIAFNPDTAIPSLEQKPDSILVMSVHPGFQGQEFVSLALEKAKEAKSRFPEVLVGMDGAIGEENIKGAFGAGIDYVMIGSRIWKAEKPVEALKHFEEIAS